MKKINEYIIEKLKINKEIKTGKFVKQPTNKEEFLNMIEKYYREWYEWEHNNDYHTKGKPINEKNYKESYDNIMECIKNIGWTGAEATLPIKFFTYMHDKHGCY